MSRRYYIVISTVVYVMLNFYYPVQKTWFNTNELTRFYLTHAIVSRGQLNIDPEIQRFGQTYDKAKIGGHYYCDKAPMQSFLSVPVFAPFYLLSRGQIDPYHSILAIRCLLHGVLGVLLFWLLYAHVYRFSGHRNFALFIAAVAIFGTPISTYFVLYFSHSLAACMLFLFYYLILRSRLRPSARYLFGLGVLGGIAVVTEFPIAVPLAILSAYLFFRIKNKPVYTAFLAGGAVVAVLLVAYNQSAFGSWLSLSYDHIDKKMYADGLREGWFGMTQPTKESVKGLLLSQRIGVFTLSPFLLFLPVGIYAVLRRLIVSEMVVLLVIVTFFYEIAAYKFWAGGVSFGARHLVPIFPFLVILAARGVFHLRRRWCGVFSWLFCSLAILSVVIFSLVNTLSPYISERHKNPLNDQVLIFLREGYFASVTPLHLVGIDGLTVFVLWFSLAIFFTAYLAYNAFNDKGRIFRVIAACCFALLLFSLHLLPEANNTEGLRQAYNRVGRLTKLDYYNAKKHALFRKYSKLVRIYRPTAE